MYRPLLAVGALIAHTSLAIPSPARDLSLLNQLTLEDVFPSPRIEELGSIQGYVDYNSTTISSTLAGSIRLVGENVPQFPVSAPPAVSWLLYFDVAISLNYLSHAYPVNSSEQASATEAVSKTIKDLRDQLKKEDILHPGVQVVGTAEGKRGSYEATLELEFAGGEQGRKSKDCTHNLADWGLEFYSRLVDGNGARQYIQFAAINSTSGAVCGFYESVKLKPATSKRDAEKTKRDSSTCRKISKKKRDSADLATRESLSSASADSVKAAVAQSTEIQITTPTFPISAPPSQIYRISNTVALVLFFASHPFPHNSTEVGPSTSATLSALDNASNFLKTLNATSSLPGEDQFYSSVASPKGDVAAIIEFAKTKDVCRAGVLLQGLNYWGSMVRREGARPTFSFHVIGNATGEMCTVHVDVRLVGQETAQMLSDSGPTDPGLDIVAS